VKKILENYNIFGFLKNSIQMMMWNIPMMWNDKVHGGNAMVAKYYI
jgi:hypothetical protein